MNYHLVFTQSRILQRLCTPRVIMNELYKSNLMILARKQYLFQLVSVVPLERYNLMKKSFFRTLLEFSPYWDSKPANAIHSDGEIVYIPVIKF